MQKFETPEIDRIIGNKHNLEKKQLIIRENNDFMTIKNWEIGYNSSEGFCFLQQQR